MKKEKKKNYESPTTECTLVELENSICAASITDDDKKGVTVNSNAQDYESFDASGKNENGTDIIKWD